MKYIFDFDDVLFNNTSMFKEHMFKVVASAGVPEIEARNYYGRPEVHGQEFSLRRFIKDLFNIYDVNTDEFPIEEIYFKIMHESRKFVNTELVNEVRRVGVENCYIVTNGDKEFNTDKLKYSGVWDLFGGKRIQIVPKGKKVAIQRIRAELKKDEKIVFLDNREEFLNEVRDIPNLIPILYHSQSVSELTDEISRAVAQKDAPRELKRRK